jgi:LytS/YehU family sensor histidine kinase
MDYLVSECNNNFIPLEKEIKLISDYVELQRIRYGDRLYFEMNITGDMNSVLIPPLVFFPLVENCFKHGSSPDPGNPWIKLYLEEIENGMRFTAVNSVFSRSRQNPQRNNQSTAGSFPMRLKALLPGKYKLKIDQGATEYYVKLEVYL